MSLSGFDKLRPEYSTYEWDFESSGEYVPQRAERLVEGIRCEYCTVFNSKSHGNCESCGAPLPAPSSQNPFIPQLRGVKK